MKLEEILPALRDGKIKMIYRTGDAGVYHTKTSPWSLRGEDLISEDWEIKKDDTELKAMRDKCPHHELESRSHHKLVRSLYTSDTMAEHIECDECGLWLSGPSEIYTRISPGTEIKTIKSAFPGF